MMCPESQFWWNWWVNFAVAAGTLFLAAIALFGDKLRARFFPPRLELKIKSKEGEKTQLTDQNGKFLDDTRYYYIVVSNRRRWSPAAQTQVFITRLEVYGHSGDLQAKWFGDIPVRWRNQEFVPLVRTIGPDTDCDFCRVEKKGLLVLMPLVPANNFPAVWQDEGKFVVTLQARSDVADSQIFRVRVAWDGQWDDGVEEMKQHFDIKPA
jgi:hypothetical protein